MNEGIGSTPIVVIIVVFIAIASAYMAYNVNYTKAFRLKNKIISVYEEYDGECGQACKEEILAYADQIGYSSIRFNCRNQFQPESYEGTPKYIDPPGYCLYKVKGSSSSRDDVIEDSSINPGYYYRIVTRVNIDIPIVNNVFGLRFLYVSGDTKTMGKGR